MGVRSIEQEATKRVSACATTPTSGFLCRSAATQDRDWYTGSALASSSGLVTTGRAPIVRRTRSARRRDDGGRP